MRQFKQIKTYPGFAELGTKAHEVETDPGFPSHYRLRCGNDKNGWIIPADEIEKWPEFWMEVYEYQVNIS